MINKIKKILLYFFSHRTLALLRWDFHFLKIRLLNVLFFKRVRLTKKIEKNQGPKYLNLGSGPRGLDDKIWVNIDGFKDINVHYLCDFTRPLPFKEDFFDGIFCEHVLEHFDQDHGRKLLNECYRILKSGGVLRIVVPDGEIILNGYMSNLFDIVEYKKPKSKLPIEAVNMWFYQRYEHQCIYDSKWLIYVLKKIGFSKIQKVSFGEAFYSPIIVLDDKKYINESLYIEAQK